MLTRWIGIPYQINGTPPTSADCWTLARAYAWEALGQRWPDYMYDAARFKRDVYAIFIDQMRAHGRWQAVGVAPEPGDLLVLRIQGIAMHCGVCIGNGDMLHTMHGRLSCIERIANWQEAVAGVFRWVGGRDGS